MGKTRGCKVISQGHNCGLFCCSCLYCFYSPVLAAADAATRLLRGRVLTAPWLKASPCLRRFLNVQKCVNLFGRRHRLGNGNIL